LNFFFGFWYKYCLLCHFLRGTAFFFLLVLLFFTFKVTYFFKRDSLSKRDCWVRRFLINFWLLYKVKTLYLIFLRMILLFLKSFLNVLSIRILVKPGLLCSQNHRKLEIFFVSFLLLILFIGTVFFILIFLNDFLIIEIFPCLGPISLVIILKLRWILL
jgi:hypothetical protein